MKCVRFFFQIAAFAIFGLVGRLIGLSTSGPERTSRYAKRILKILGARIHFQGPDFMINRSSTGRLVVCNHLGYLDILVLASLKPIVFITSVELRSRPLLGLLSELGGSHFVERRSPARLKGDIARIARTLVSGRDVLLFAEGTSSNGDCVQPFRTGIFKAAQMVGADVLPVAIAYTHLNNRPLSLHGRDILHWYGDMEFFPHLWDLLTSVQNFNVRVILGKPIQISTELEPRSLSHRSWIDVKNLYQIVSQRLS